MHPESESIFLPRNCCSKHRIWYSKVIGLLKNEFEGKEMIAPN